MRLVAALLLVATLSACATTRDGSTAAGEADPYERFNRGMFAFNDALDDVAIKPATVVYRTVTPVPARRGLSGVLSNLSEPFSFINNLLQGKPGRAFNNLGRFLINSTIGVGGLADHATDLGLPQTREDFGQTLASYGAKNSPYLVLPLLGPSTLRDAAGRAVQIVADPAQLAISSEISSTAATGVTVARVIDGRSYLIETGADVVFESSADPYAAARSTYFQRRRAAIADEDALAGPATEQGEQELLDQALEDDAIDAAPDPQLVEPPPL